MREIKFRAWNKRLKRMYVVYSINWQTGIICCTDCITGTSHTFGFIDCILLQWTGIKDKNGVEIYEGDIMHSEQWVPKNHVVIFEDGAFGFSSPLVPCYVNSLHYLEKFEIIGNIHQGPELLESKNEN